MSDGHGRFTVKDAPAESAGAVAAQFVDYDNDGLLDLFVVRADGASSVPERRRPLGRHDGTCRAGRSPRSSHGRYQAPGRRRRRSRRRRRHRRASCACRAVRCECGATTAAPASTRCASPRSTASNRSGVGTKVEIRAGSLRQRSRPPRRSRRPRPPTFSSVSAARRRRRRPRPVAVGHPAGRGAAGTAAPARRSQTVKVTELNRKPSSCPFLFTWNGSAIRVRDRLHGRRRDGLLGGAGRARNTPDPDEYVRIGGDQLAAARRPLRAAHHQRARGGAVRRSRCSSSPSITRPASTSIQTKA